MVPCVESPYKGGTNGVFLYANFPDYVSFKRLMQEKVKRLVGVSMLIDVMNKSVRLVLLLQKDEKW